MFHIGIKFSYIVLKLNDLQSLSHNFRLYRLNNTDSRSNNYK